MTENYLTLLEESLRQKQQVMAEIQEYNLRQEELFKSGNVDFDKFDEYVEEKGSLVDRLTTLDVGFEQLYTKVAEELQGNRQRYACQIKELQQLIGEITDTSVLIQAQEARNKALIEEYFRKAREGVCMGRRSTQAARNYYKTMSKSAGPVSIFMDSKK